MKVKQAIKKLEDNGYKISRQWFYILGKKLGFIETVESTGDIVINEPKLNQFIESIKEVELGNYVSLKDASEKTNTPISYYYKYSIFGETAGFKKFGYGIEKNKCLVNLERFDEFIKERNFGYPKKWEKEYD